MSWAESPVTENWCRLKWTVSKFRNGAAEANTVRLCDYRQTRQYGQAAGESDGPQRTGAGRRTVLYPGHSHFRTTQLFSRFPERKHVLTKRKHILIKMYLSLANFHAVWTVLTPCLRTRGDIFWQGVPHLAGHRGSANWKQKRLANGKASLPLTEKEDDRDEKHFKF